MNGRRVMTARCQAHDQATSLGNLEELLASKLDRRDINGRKISVYICSPACIDVAGGAVNRAARITWRYFQFAYVSMERGKLVRRLM